MATLTIAGIQKSYGKVLALEAIDLAIRDGEFLALLGPSGCGKTTLLRIIAGLETQSAGAVLIGERDVTELPPSQRGLAMVFQNYAVFPHLTVSDNIAFGLTMQRRDKAFIRQKVERCASLLRLEPYLDRYPAKLSGGQRQRVAVARALAVEPAVLLMDEPLSNLDALLRLDMRSELKAILQEAGTTTIYVTHDQGEALALADRICVMQKGKIEQIGVPQEIYARPTTRFVGGFVGNPPMNFVPATALARMALLSDVAADKATLTIGFRAEDVTLADGAADLVFSVRTVEPMGSHLLVTGHCGDVLTRIALSPDDQVKSGDTLHLALAKAKLSVFNDRGVRV